MYKVKYIVFILLLMSAFQSCKTGEQQAVELNNLMCESFENPVGIDNPVPKLGWGIETNTREWKQAAYQIMVSTDSLKLINNEGDTWNSGKVNSGDSQFVRYSGSQLVPLKKYWWKVKIWGIDGTESPWSKPAFWVTALGERANWQGSWIESDLELTNLQKEIKAEPDFIMDQEENEWGRADKIRKKKVKVTKAPAVYLRKETELNKPIKSAFASICGLGLNELYINGNKVSKGYLNPANTDYEKRINYETYDVSSYLNKGGNAFGVILGNGWYNLIVEHLLRNGTADYINTPRLLFQLEIVFTDGSQKTIVSDNSWKFTTDGPIVFNNLTSGETYDFNKNIKGWDNSEYEDEAWKKAILQEAPKGDLIAQLIHPVRPTDSIKATKINPINGGYSVEMEREFTGWCNIKVTGNKGDKITVKYPGADSHTLGRYQTYEYVLSGEGNETLGAKFSYNGVNKVEIYGLNYRPDVSDIIGMSVVTDFPLAGNFSCSNDTLNELYSILKQTLCNFTVHIPNDPVREKSGWANDGMSTFEAYAYSYNSLSMFKKWQNDFLDNIQDNGYVPPVAPGRYIGKNINGPWWGGMIVWQPWKTYQFTGDKTVLEESYEAMKKYVGYLMSVDSSYVLNWGLGDWLEVGSEMRPIKTPVPVTSTIGYYSMVMVTAKTAKILGFEKEAKEYFAIAERIKKAYNQKFFDAETAEYGKYSQASQLMSLYFDLVPDRQRERVLDKLVKKINSADNHVGTGFVATAYLLNGLSDLGQGELAYEIANQKDFPGWYDMVFNHGTKIFKESWTATVQMPVLGGGLGHWLYHSLLGIQPDPAVPGFKKIIIRPDFVDKLSWVKGHYNSQYGTIVSDWKKDGKKCLLNVTIPANTEGKIILPTNDFNGILESGDNLNDAKGITSVKVENGNTIIEVGSGDYSFQFAK